VRSRDTGETPDPNGQPVRSRSAGETPDPSVIARRSRSKLGEGNRGENMSLTKGPTGVIIVLTKWHFYDDTTG